MRPGEADVRHGPDGEPATRVSVLVCVHDRAAKLEACLQRLDFADEIVVVFDRGDDASAASACEHGAIAVAGAFGADGERKRAGWSACTGDWVLEIAADEWVSPSLAAEIQAVVAASTYDWHRLSIDDCVEPRHVPRGWRVSAVRLFRRGMKDWGAGLVDPQSFTGHEGPPLLNPLHRHVDARVTEVLKWKILDALEWGFLIALMACFCPLVFVLGLWLEPGVADPASWNVEEQ